MYAAIEMMKAGNTTADVAAKLPDYADDEFGTVTLQQFAHSIGLSLYEGMWISRAYSLDYPVELEEGMYFAAETFAGPPGPRADGAAGGEPPRHQGRAGASSPSTRSPTRRSPERRVLVTDHVFGGLEIERALLEPLGAELVLAPAADEETLVGLCGRRRRAAGLLRAGRRARRQAAADAGCRVISRYGHRLRQHRRRDGDAQRHRRHPRAGLLPRRGRRPRARAAARRGARRSARAARCARRRLDGAARACTGSAGVGSRSSASARSAPGSPARARASASRSSPTTRTRRLAGGRRARARRSRRRSPRPTRSRCTRR